MPTPACFDVPAAAAGQPADRDMGRRHHPADRRRHVGADDRRLLLPAGPAVGRRCGRSRRRRRGSTAAWPGSACSTWTPCCRCTPTSTTPWTPQWSPSAPAPSWSAGRRPPRSAAVTACPPTGCWSPSPGTPMTLGAYDVTLIESEHCPPDRFPGVITEPVMPPVQGVGLPVRRSVVDAGAPPADRSSAADRGQRGLRSRCARRRRAPKSSISASANSACSRSPTWSTTGPRRCARSARAGSCSSTGTTSSGRWTAAARIAVRR